MPRAAQLLITGIAAVAGAWLLLWPIITGTLSRPADAGHDRDEQQEEPAEERPSGFEHRDDRG